MSGGLHQNLIFACKSDRTGALLKMAHLMSTTMAGLFSTLAMLAVERTLTRMTRFHTIFVWGKSGIFFPPTHFYLCVTSKNKSCLFILQKMGSNFSRICQPVQVATTPNGPTHFSGPAGRPQDGVEN
jgi:hypothetical protein